MAAYSVEHVGNAPSVVFIREFSDTSLWLHAYFEIIYCVDDIHPVELIIFS